MCMIARRDRLQNPAHSEWAPMRGTPGRGVGGRGGDRRPHCSEGGGRLLQPSPPTSPLPEEAASVGRDEVGVGDDVAPSTKPIHRSTASSKSPKWRVNSPFLGPSLPPPLSPGLCSEEKTSHSHRCLSSVQKSLAFPEDDLIPAG